MATYTKYYCFVEDVNHKVHNLGSDTLKIALTNSAPNVSTHDELADVSQVANGSGYTTGGEAINITASSQTTGTYKLVGDDVVWTASGSMGPFRYAVFYNDTAANDELIAYWDYASSITLASGETFTLNLDQSGGIFTMT